GGPARAGALPNRRRGRRSAGAGAARDRGIPGQTPYGARIRAMSASHRKSAGGFTLVELIVSLAILGLVLLGAQRLLAAARAGGNAIRAARVETERSRNAARWLRAAFESLRVGVDGDDSFRGGTDTLEFSSRLQTSEAGFEVER